MSSKQNDETIRVYNTSLDAYIKHTPHTYQENHLPLLHWINTTIGLLPKSAKILEIGSGIGREADYLIDQGFKVTLSDGAQSFVDYLNIMGKNACLLNILNDPILKKYDMVFANAVISHFTHSDFRMVLEKVKSALNPGGIFAFSTKQGEGEVWVNEKSHEKRYINLWSPDTLRNVVEDAGYKIVFFEADIPGDLPSHTWINLSAYKQ